MQHNIMSSVAVFTALGMSFCAQTIHGLMCCWLFKVGVQILDFCGVLPVFLHPILSATVVDTFLVGHKCPWNATN